MYTLIGITSGALLIVGFGLLLKRISKRTTVPLATPADLLRSQERVEFLLGRARSRRNPVVEEFVRCSLPFLRRANSALEFDRPMRARIHINLVAMVTAWADVILSDANADVPRMTTTRQLGVALALLELNKHELAIEEFDKVWLDQHAHVSARRVAIMGRLWINATLGRHAEAAEDEQQLLLLREVLKMADAEVTFQVSKDPD